MKMSLKEILCDNSQTFDFAFGIGIATLLVLFAITLIIVLILYVDNRRRKRIYKHKYRKCSTKEMETSKDLIRALTYMSYKIQNGQLKPSEIIKPENVCDLLKDTSMDEHRNMAAANIAFFFAAEPRKKSTVGSPSSRKSIEIQKPKTIYDRPQQPSGVVCGTGSRHKPAGIGSPPVVIVGSQQPSRPKTVTVGSPPGTESTASNVGSPLMSPKPMSPVGSPKHSFQAPGKIKIEKEEGIHANLASKKENAGKTAALQNN